MTEWVCVRAHTHPRTHTHVFPFSHSLHTGFALSSWVNHPIPSCSSFLSISHVGPHSGFLGSTLPGPGLSSGCWSGCFCRHLVAALDSVPCLPSPACIVPPSFKWQLGLPLPRLRTDLKATFSPGFAWEGGGTGEVSGLGSWWSRGKWGKSSEGGVPPPRGEEASWGSMRSRAADHSPPPQGYREVRLTMGSLWSWTTERRGFQSILSEPVPLHRVGRKRVFACRGHQRPGQWTLW